MKIKLTILENDKGYLKRITDFFSTRYADRLDIYAGSDREETLAYVQENKVDILLASDFFEIDPMEIPPRTRLSYLTDAAEKKEVNDCPAVFKYQKADMIFKQILNISAESMGAFSFGDGEERAVIVGFSSPCGGVGTSAAAAACAKHFAGDGKRVCYLNLSSFGDTDLYFHADGVYTISDVIYELQSRKGNIAVMLESCMRQDSEGISFLASPQIALDMMELSWEEKKLLVTELSKSGKFDYIIIDMDFSLSTESRNFMRLFQAIVWISDGSESANSKTVRAAEALRLLEEDETNSLLPRISLIYNRFSSRNGMKIADFELRSIGGAGRFEYQKPDQLLTFLAAKEYYDEILN